MAHGLRASHCKTQLDETNIRLAAATHCPAVLPLICGGGAVTKDRPTFGTSCTREQVGAGNRLLSTAALSPGFFLKDEDCRIALLDDPHIAAAAVTMGGEDAYGLEERLGAGFLLVLR